MVFEGPCVDVLDGVELGKLPRFVDAVGNGEGCGMVGEGITEDLFTTISFESFYSLFAL